MGRSSAAMITLQDIDDPLALALAPPPNETPAERAARERAEARAKARSDAIDNRLKEESLARKKRGVPIRVLLLGQSESGKSTTLKNFQLTYARKSWVAEKDAWRAVIQLNFVRTINAILDVVANEFLISDTGASEMDVETETASVGDLDQDPDLIDLDLGVRKPKRSDDEDSSFLLASRPSQDHPISNSNSGSGSASKGKGKGKLLGQGDETKTTTEVVVRKTYALTDELRALLSALSPLRAVQRELEARLGSGATEDLFGLSPSSSSLASPIDALGNVRTPVSADGAMITTTATTATTAVVGSPASLQDITNVGNVPFLSSSSPSSHAGAGRKVDGEENTNTNTDTNSWTPAKARALRARKTQSQEFFVRSTGWKSALSKLRPRGAGTGRASSDEVSSERDEASRVIYQLADEIRRLWGEGVVKDIVRTRGVKLGDSGEFFLDEAERVASLRYSPTDDDIIRARLRTVGVQEHSIVLESGPEPGREWIIYDVGGTRSMRAQWPAYFDDVNAIIFLAPINVFDEKLAEDARVNRLDDSLQLWKLVCGHRLLVRTELVLFLNKCDLLDRKLRGGVVFGEYVKAYKGENSAVGVCKFLKAVFTEVCRKYSKQHRGLHIYFTSVIDTKATAKTLAAVQDGILRFNLRNLDLI